jgi:hypothetical protein
VDADNLVRFGTKGIYSNNLELSKAQSIKVQSQSEQTNAPLAIDFKDFNMETISNIAVKDDLEISGNINGTAIIKNLSQSPLLLLT